MEQPQFPPKRRFPIQHPPNREDALRVSLLALAPELQGAQEDLLSLFKISRDAPGVGDKGQAEAHDSRTPFLLPLNELGDALRKLGKLHRHPGGPARGLLAHLAQPYRDLPGLVGPRLLDVEPPHLFGRSEESLAQLLGLLPGLSNLLRTQSPDQEILLRVRGGPA